MNVTTFRKDMFNILKNVVSDKPTRITNRNDTYVIMTEDDYSAMQETIYLLQDPELAKSLSCLDEELYDKKDLAWNCGH